MDNVLTILIAVGGIAISLYMSARKKEKEKAGKIEQNRPFPKKSIFETILSDLTIDAEVEKRQEKKQKTISFDARSSEPSFVEGGTQRVVNHEKEEIDSLANEVNFDTVSFTLKDAVIYDAILNRKYQ